MGSYKTREIIYYEVRYMINTIVKKRGKLSFLDPTKAIKVSEEIFEKPKIHY